MKRFIIAWIFLASAVWSQSFEAVSIRPRVSDRGISIRISGARLTAANVNLRGLILYAYDLKGYQLSGLPGWAEGDGYDVIAKAPGDETITRDQARAMMKSLLGERFAVKIHSEIKELPVYNLVVTKEGSKLRAPAPDAKPILMSTGETVTVTAGRMTQLADHLSAMRAIGRPVIDKTNLAGAYDYTLTAATDESKVDLDRQSIFTAVQDQLGLKLEPGTARIAVSVVDHAEHPTEN